jgi:hypothetical protein
MKKKLTGLMAALLLIAGFAFIGTKELPSEYGNDGIFELPSEY